MNSIKVNNRVYYQQFLQLNISLCISLDFQIILVCLSSLCKVALQEIMDLKLGNLKLSAFSLEAKGDSQRPGKKWEFMILDREKKGNTVQDCLNFFECKEP